MEGEHHESVLRYHLVYVALDHCGRDRRGHHDGLDPQGEVVRAVDEQVRLGDAVSQGPREQVVALGLDLAYHQCVVCSVRVCEESRRPVGEPKALEHREAVGKLEVGVDPLRVVVGSESH